jgi:NADPH:quinone reductase-like Zn-dependent oxidoreductase
LWVATDGVENFAWWAWTAVVGDRKLVFAAPRQTQEDLLVVRDLVEEGRYRAVVDRVYPLEDVAEAHRYVETWRKVGSVVVVLDPEAGRRPAPL